MVLSSSRPGTAAWLLLALSTSLLVGCSSQEFPTAPAGGSVTVDGKPFTTGQVMFTPMSQREDNLAGPAAIGSLDDEGHFELRSSGDVTGAVIGPHQVTVINTADKETAKASGIRFDRIKVPTGVFTVEAGEQNQFAIELTSEMLRRYASR
ncbi:MAG: hypothetical protein AAGF31_03630 [Planctomycetota bacterium]